MPGEGGPGPPLRGSDEEGQRQRRLYDMLAVKESEIKDVTTSIKEAEKNKTTPEDVKSKILDAIVSRKKRLATLVEERAAIQKKIDALTEPMAGGPPPPQQIDSELQMDERVRTAEAKVDLLVEQNRKKRPMAMSKASISQIQEVLLKSHTLVKLYKGEVVPDEFCKDFNFEIDWNKYHDEPAATEPVAKILREAILESDIGLNQRFRADVVMEDELWKNVPFPVKENTIEASGKTDIVFLPISVDPISAAQTLCIEYDLNKPDTILGSKPIQIFHLLAASRISNRPVLSVFSDQSTMTRLLRLGEKNGKVVVYCRETADLRDAAYEMANWLQCSDPESIPAPFDESEPEAHEHASKRSRMDDAWKGLQTIQEQEEVSEVLVNELDVIDTFAPSKLDAAVEKFFVMQQHMPWRMPNIG